MDGDPPTPGCRPPSTWMQTPRMQTPTPLDTDPLPPYATPPGHVTFDAYWEANPPCWSCYLWCMLGSQPPPPPPRRGQNDRRVKIYPCPKLRSQAVMRTVSIESLHSCCSVDADTWCKRTLKVQPSGSNNAAMTLVNCSHWKQCSYSRIGLQPILEWLHCFQWEQYY